MTSKLTESTPTSAAIDYSPNTHPQLDPAPILQTAFAFWSSKVLLTAVEFELFTKLGDRGITGAELGAEVGLHPRGISDFFDALVAMKFLDREGEGPEQLARSQQPFRQLDTGPGEPPAGRVPGVG